MRLFKSILFFCLSVATLMLPLATYARGGCFTAGTLILTPTGEKAIETLRAGDEIVSYNTQTHKKEISIIGEVQVLKREGVYIINGTTRVTGEHPFYVQDVSGKLIISEVQTLKVGDVLVRENGATESIQTLEKQTGEVTVYNLLDVSPNNNYFANGYLVHNKGGCFAAGTLILTPTGEKAIELLRAGDEIVSYNTQTQTKEISIIGEVQVLKREGIYIINGTTRVTGEHPFYVQDKSGKLIISEVQTLKVGDVLVRENGATEAIQTLEKQTGEVLVYNLLDVSPNNNYFANGYLVHNKGGCFAAGTLILTPTGEKAIETLRAGDEIVSYNTKTKTKEISIIGEVQVLKREGIYIINGTTRVTGEHPFYVQGLSISEVQTLKVGDVLVRESGATEAIQTLEKQTGEVTVYNLLDVSPNNNYFANGYLVHNKGSSRSSKPSPACTVGGLSYNAQKCERENFITNAIVGIMFVLFFTVHYIKSLWLRNKLFSKNDQIVESTKKICPKFENRYNTSYVSGTEIRKKIPPKPEVDESEYRMHISRFTLLERVKYFFERYESDWSRKNFESIASYTSSDFFEKQMNIFRADFGAGWDIMLDVQIESITPILTLRDEEGAKVTCQINASMINFSLDGNGKVDSGKSSVRGFSEYWTFILKPDGDIQLDEIHQV